MFQALLKTAQVKPNHKTPSPINSQIQSTQSNKELQDDGWGTPSNQLHSNHQPDEDSETPGFLDRVSKLSRRIEIAQRDLPSGVKFEQYEKSSQILQVNELMNDEHSLVYNANKNKHSAVNKLNYLRMRNAVSQMRQAHFDLAEYLEDERRLMEDFHEKMCLDIQDFFNQYRQKLAQTSNQGQIENMRRQNSMLRQRMERKQTELQKVSRDLQQTKTALQQKSKEANKIMSKEESSVAKCTSCRTVQLKMMQLSEQLKKSEQQIDKLLIQNQRLQEYIFDIEQKIAGVDLEVERKIKQRMLEIPQLQKQAPNSNNAQAQKLKEEIQLLQSKCRKLEQNARKTEQTTRTLQITSKRAMELNMKQQTLNKRQQQLHNYELTIIDSQKQLEELKQANYERETQILQAEDNLNKKINELRDKQNDLSRWQAELTWKTNQSKNRPASKANLQLDEANYRAEQQPRRAVQQNYRVKQPPAYQANENNYKPNYLNQIKNSRQMSIKSFGKSPQQDMPQGYLEEKSSPRMKTYEQDYQHKNYYQPRGEYYQNRYETGRRKPEARPHIENQYLNKNRDQYHNIGRKQGLTGSNYRDNREASPYQNVTQMRGRPMHHVGVATNAGHYRDLSKSSRHSAAKSIKNVYVPVSSGPSYPPKNEGHLMGLGNKLQRLREQIKRQIESIK